MKYEKKAITVIRAIKAKTNVQNGIGSGAWYSFTFAGLNFGVFGGFGGGGAEYPHIGQPFWNILSGPE